MSAPAMSAPTKRRVKALYTKAEIGLSEALAALMFDHDMDRGEALRYLGP